MDALIREQFEFVLIGVALAGAVIGLLLELWSDRMCASFRRDTNLPIATDSATGRRIGLVTGTAVVFGGYVVCVFAMNAHRTPEVQPDGYSIYLRAGGHLFLLALLIAATATDFRDYIIPDQITVPGTIFGVLLATLSGDTQIIHLWVDWNDALAELRGPAIPEWVRAHRHLHGFVWSVGGLLAGGGVTWLVRWSSALILGQQSLGFGDVTLMAMVGSFLGWQPVVFIFLLAPICGLVVGISVRLLTNRPYLPFGPYLSLGTLVVLLSWQQLWMFEISNEFSIRRLFGDGPGLAILGGASFFALIVLLGGLRIYRMVPGKERPNANSAE